MSNEYHKIKTWTDIIKSKNYDLAYVYWEALEENDEINQCSKNSDEGSGECYYIN